MISNLSPRPCFLIFATRSAVRPVIFLLIALLILAELPSTACAEDGQANANRIIQYRGSLPLLGKDTWGQEVELKFELYRSPSGGTPFWSETTRVPVATNGWASINLGKVQPLPDEVFKTPFRFLSIWRDQVEFVPRKQVVSVVYVTSPNEEGKTKEEYLARALSEARTAADQAPNREHRLDALVDCGAFSMETHPRLPATWLEASATATRLGAHLATFDEWYGAYDGKEAKNLVGLEGHYEWVIPWVYEPAIHARMHELYRGKPVACYYNEISPLNSYSFRLVQLRSPSK